MEPTTKEKATRYKMWIRKSSLLKSVYFAPFLSWKWNHWKLLEFSFPELITQELLPHGEGATHPATRHGT